MPLLIGMVLKQLWRENWSDQGVFLDAGYFLTGKGPLELLGNFKAL